MPIEIECLLVASFAVRATDCSPSLTLIAHPSPADVPAQPPQPAHAGIMGLITWPDLLFQAPAIDSRASRWGRPVDNSAIFIQTNVQIAHASEASCQDSCTAISPPIRSSRCMTVSKLYSQASYFDANSCSTAEVSRTRHSRVVHEYHLPSHV